MPLVAKILVVDDDAVVRLFLQSVLERQGYKVLQAVSGQDGLAKAAQWAPDLLLVDLGLPDMDGIDLVVQLREWMQMPILVLSMRDNESSKVAALDAGADDYLTKPVSTAELLARLRVALRHAQRVKAPKEQAAFAADGLLVDFAAREVSLHGKRIHLTPIEYKLLAHLVHRAGQVVRHHDLLHAVWGANYENETNYLRIYIKHLRHKIESDPACPRFLLNDPGVGYRFVAEKPEQGEASSS